MSFSPNEKGQGLVEYALILILLIIIVLVVIRLFGPSISDFVNNLLSTPTPTPTPAPEAFTSLLGKIAVATELL
jgi:pilus assembly protein Flp/PilA